MSAQAISHKPYFLRALHEWCVDSGFTPYIAVRVDDRTRVPAQYVKDGQIVLNISYGATTALKMGNELIECSARFSGVAFKIEVPVDNVLAIFAQETQEGMSFQVTPAVQAPSQEIAEPNTTMKTAADKGFLKVVK